MFRLLCQKYLLVEVSASRLWAEICAQQWEIGKGLVLPFHLVTVLLSAFIHQNVSSSEIQAPLSHNN